MITAVFRKMIMGGVLVGALCNSNPELLRAVTLEVSTLSLLFTE